MTSEIVAARALGLWALGAGLLPCLLRVGVLAGFGLASHDAVDYWASLLRWPGQSLIALAVGWFFLATGARRALGLLLAALWIGLEVVAAHFEAAFGELPTFQAGLQLAASRGASSSISAAAPPLWLGLEWGLCMAALYAGGLPVLASRVSAALRGRARIALISMAALGLGLALVPDALPSRVYWSSQLPLLHLARAPAVPALSSEVLPLQAATSTPPSDVIAASAEEPSAAQAPSDERIAMLHATQRDFGHDVAFASGLHAAPLCADRPRVTTGSVASPTGASVVLLILEGVGHLELARRMDGALVMPALAEIAARHFSAERFYAAGTQSAQALPSLFAGQPAQTAQKLLLRIPLPHLQGFPAQLRDAGYRTGYFHGGDLSFEQQRVFLADVGFEDMIEYQPSESHLSQAGWGLADGEVFVKLRDWITRQRAGGIPYFASFATISSHHPFALPAHYAAVFGMDQPDRAFASALRYLDEEIDRFYRWFQREEAPRGSWLVLVGDHSPMLENSAALAKRQPARTDVAFVIVPPTGFDSERLAQGRSRLGSHMDVSRTLGALLGQPPLPCDQGLDLFGPSTQARTQRIIHSIAGRDLNEVYLISGEVDAGSSGEIRARLDRRAGKLQRLNPSGQRGDDARAELARLNRYLKRLLPLSRELLENDSLAPPATRPTAEAPLADALAPLVVSHRGRSRLGESASDNSLAAIAQAAERGFTRVEVDVQLTRDGVTVLFHDSEFSDTSGKTQGVPELTLLQLRARHPGLVLATLDEALDRFADKLHFHIEAKPQRLAQLNMALAHAIVRSIEARRGKGPMRPVVVDSFNLMIASSVARHCECEVAWDTPFQKPIGEATVGIARRAGMAWLYAHHSVVSAEALSLSHAQGLRLLAYTANRPDDLTPLAGRVPDGIISDSASMIEGWRASARGGSVAAEVPLRSNLPEAIE